MKKVTAYAPATMANIMVGFDALGACLELVDGTLLGDRVTLLAADQLNIEVKGKYAQFLPINAHDNVVANCIEAFHHHLKRRDITPTTFTLQLDKGLPVGSGLGSSATSIVAALVALNGYYDNILTQQELLLIAGEMEGLVNGTVHYDNVAPCILGGLQLMVPHKGCVTLPWFLEWLVVLYYPGTEIPTKMARDILPKSYDLKSVVHYWQNLAAFVHAIHSNDSDLAASLFSDELIEPYRAKLIPRFNNGKRAAMAAGALTFGVSGSGPTCFAIAKSMQDAEKISAAIGEAMQGNDAAFSKIAKVSSLGARIIPS